MDIVRTRRRGEDYIGLSAGTIAGSAAKGEIA
jgi:hypothetical protein